jgi:hypothetical protein
MGWYSAWIATSALRWATTPAIVVSFSPGPKTALRDQSATSP